MKNIFMSALFGILVGGVAHAGLTVDLRMDDDSVSYNDTATAAGGTAAGSVNHYNWAFKTIRADYSAKLNDTMSSKIRINFNKDVNLTTGAATKSPDALNSQNDVIELAFLKHTFAENFSLSMGKIGTDVAGWENQTTSPDRYVDSRYLSSTVSKLKYLTGAMVSYKMDDQNIDLQLTNNPIDDNAAGIQDRGTFGLVYKGAFIEKTLKPIISYHSYNPQNATDPKAAYTYTTVGLRYETDAFMVDLDDDMGSLKGRTAASKTDSINTIALGFALKGNAFTPKVKYDSSKEIKVSASDVNTSVAYTDVGLAVEFKPEKDTNLNYHVAMTQLTTKPETTDASVETHYFVGIRFAGDILK